MWSCSVRWQSEFYKKNEHEAFSKRKSHHESGAGLRRTRARKGVCCENNLAFIIYFYTHTFTTHSSINTQRLSLADIGRLKDLCSRDHSFNLAHQEISFPPTIGVRVHFNMVTTEPSPIINTHAPFWPLFTRLVSRRPLRPRLWVIVFNRIPFETPRPW